MELGGYIFDNQLVIKEGSEYSFTHEESPEEVRQLAEKGAVFFHTHPSKTPSDESGTDILSTYQTLGQAIFIKDDIIILVPEKIISTAELKKLAEDLLQKSEFYDQDYYPDAYWYWNDLVRDSLPTKKSFYEQKQ